MEGFEKPRDNTSIEELLKELSLKNVQSFDKLDIVSREEWGAMYPSENAYFTEYNDDLKERLTHIFLHHSAFQGGGGDKMNGALC